jgi:hypothetical protein
VRRPSVVVFDASMTVCYEIDPQQAVSLLFSERGQPLFWEAPITSFRANLDHLPPYLELCRGDGVFLVPPYIRSYGKAPIVRPFSERPSRRGLLQRDECCQYCGSRENLTIDHVLPLSRGGPYTWQNLVIACLRCNNRKGNRTPVESGMVLKREPLAPSTGQVFARLAQIFKAPD